ncbi:hypothetical protein L204_102039 [Cryptococcus depauperatus]|nr:hypothetical protein L204_04523 [Cryptococcus depauperatus CBS 7855]
MSRRSRQQQKQLESFPKKSKKVLDQTQTGFAVQLSHVAPKLDKGKDRETVEEAGSSEGIDQEEELEAWQEFAADHYGTVEQLPLELHRNFRLLRELDDGALGQMGMLKRLIRQYVEERCTLAGSLKKLPSSPETSVSRRAQEPEVKNAKQHPSDSLSPGVGQLQQTPGVPVSDGKGGLFIHSETAVQEAKQSRRAFPSPRDAAAASALIPADRSTDVMEGHSSLNGNAQDVPIDPALLSLGTPSVPDLYDIHGEPTLATGKSDAPKLNFPPEPISTVSPKLIRPPGPHRLLPEISRLIREILRTSDEKLAVAIGAYNAIDRHIRALDSALTVQEASILLGLRPSTLPSNAIDAALDNDEMLGSGGAKDKGSDGEGVERIIDEELGLSTGGGSRRKGKKKTKAKSDQQNVEDEEKEEDFNIPADPNEPRYCYCNRVSFGQMIGCDNDDCPLEWFHLQCIGLEQPPTGKWLCDGCKSKIPDVSGGSGLKRKKK